jgi:dipeptidyl aminopeptidase/acylaminoacyl peptidase
MLTSRRQQFGAYAFILFIMTIRATKFTPEVLLEAPRRSVGAPNSNASKILYSVSSYSFAEHAKKSEIRVMDAESQQTSLITDDKSASDPTWIDDETIVYLKSEDDGTTRIIVGDPENFDSRYAASSPVSM